MLNPIDRTLEEFLHLTHEDAENHPEILINAFDKEHRIVFWNKRAEIYFGINKPAAIGKKLEALIP